MRFQQLVLKFTEQVNVWTSKTLVLFQRCRVNHGLAVIVLLNLRELTDIEIAIGIAAGLNPVYRAVNLVQIDHIIDWLKLFQAGVHAFGVGIVEESRIEVFLQSSAEAIDIMDVQTVKSSLVKEIVVGREDVYT